MIEVVLLRLDAGVEWAFNSSTFGLLRGGLL